jgi:hypothetical protein
MSDNITKSDKQDLVNSYLMIRTIIGILGIALPFILLIIPGKLLPSISDYYYTKSSVFLISILTSYALLLISYKGYPKKTGEWFSDNQITHFGGFMALMVVFIPTTFDGCCEGKLCCDCLKSCYPLFMNLNKLYGNIHLICAALFLISMGYMSYVQFSKGEKTIYNRIYKVCGLIIWIAVGILIFKFLFNYIIKPKEDIFFKNDTYYLETISVLAFGISWLVKGKTLKKLINGLFRIQETITK